MRVEDSDGPLWSRKTVRRFVVGYVSLGSRLLGKVGITRGNDIGVVGDGIGIFDVLDIVLGD